MKEYSGIFHVYVAYEEKGRVKWCILTAVRKILLAFLPQSP